MRPTGVGGGMPQLPMQAQASYPVSPSMGGDTNWMPGSPPMNAMPAPMPVVPGGVSPGGMPGNAGPGNPNAGGKGNGNAWGREFRDQYGVAPGQNRTAWDEFRATNGIGGGNPQQPPQSAIGAAAPVNTAAPLPGAPPMTVQPQDRAAQLQQWQAQRPGYQSGSDISSFLTQLSNWRGQRPMTRFGGWNR